MEYSSFECLTVERRGPVVAVLGSGVGLLVAATLLVFPRTAAVIFPTPGTFGAIGRALHGSSQNEYGRR